MDTQVDTCCPIDQRLTKDTRATLSERSTFGVTGFRLPVSA